LRACGALAGSGLQSRASGRLVRILDGQMMQSRRLRKSLGRIVGEENVKTGEAERICYSYDATRLEFEPQAVVFAVSKEQIVELVKFANAERVPIFARGAGSGFTGGSLPTREGIALVLTKMNRIEEVDLANLVATVQPGVVNADLRRAVEKRGLFSPPDPASLKVSTIGGNVAECAGGPSCVKYGVTRNYVLGLEVVLGTGEVIRTGGKMVKNVAGYDLTRLFCGSEGTLGIFTRIYLRLIPLPEHKVTILAVFNSVKDAARAVAAIISARILPSALEFMDAMCIRAVQSYKHTGLPVGAGALLIIEADGPKDALSGQRKRIVSICKETGAARIDSAEDFEASEELWEARRAISPSVARLAPRKLNEDVAVPPAQIPELMRRIGELRGRTGLMIPCFGHAGDGNIHVNILYDPAVEGQEEKAKLAASQVFEIALSLGGTITGEHGIGITKREFLQRQLGRTQVELMRSLKRAFDPNNILNPGKIF